jgi:hypothetical protein
VPSQLPQQKKYNYYAEAFTGGRRSANETTEMSNTEKFVKQNSTVDDSSRRKSLPPTPALRP